MYKKKKTAKKRKLKGNEDENIEFSWTDDDIQLLLNSALSLKSDSEYEGLSWESKRAKYDIIFEKMLQKEYPERSLELLRTSLTKTEL